MNLVVQKKGEYLTVICKYIVSTDRFVIRLINTASSDNPGKKGVNMIKIIIIEKILKIDKIELTLLNINNKKS